MNVENTLLNLNFNQLEKVYIFVRHVEMSENKTKCKYCGEPIVFHQSKRTGKWYTCNSSNPMDFHTCYRGDPIEAPKEKPLNVRNELKDLDFKIEDLANKLKWRIDALKARMDNYDKKKRTSL